MIRILAKKLIERSHNCFMNNYLPLEICPLCENSQRTLVFSVNDCIGTNQEFDLVRCLGCSHVYVTPVPIKGTLGRYYPEEYYSYNINVEKINRRLRYRVKKWIFNWQGKWQWLRKLLRSFLENQVAVMPMFYRRGKILDVGCGTGRFLSLIEDLGWETYGIEISKQATEIVRKNGHQVFCGNLLDANYPSKFFDVITYDNTLEHILRPVKCLEETYRILKPQGEVVVCVPNFDCWERTIFQKDWHHLPVPLHLHHFGYESLSYLLSKTGFKILKVKYALRMGAIRPNLRVIRRKFGIFNLNSLQIHIFSMLLLSGYILLLPLSYTRLARKMGIYLIIHGRK
ncbi:Ubiquinone biosynthesis O-methyltransferase, mitochondrial [subsurface metagenome]